MAVIPFPVSSEPADQPTPKAVPQNSILGIDLTALVGSLVAACGDLTVGDALQELSKTPLKDVMRELFGITA